MYLLSFYHKWEMVKGRAEYTAAVCLEDIPSDLPSNVMTAEIPATRVYTLRHIGDYLHLGNAWSTLYTMQRNKEINCKKGIHPFEVYVNSPLEVDSTDLITDIKFAIS